MKTFNTMHPVPASSVEDSTSVCVTPHVLIVPLPRNMQSADPSVENMLLVLYGLLALLSLVRLVMPMLFTWQGDTEEGRRGKREAVWNSGEWRPVVTSVMKDLENIYRIKESKMNQFTPSVSSKNKEEGDAGHDCTRPVILMMQMSSSTAQDNDGLMDTLLAGIPAFIHHI